MLGGAMLSHFLNPPNWFTAASLFCSVSAMSLLSSGEPPSRATFARAAVLVVFGGLFDLLDGRVARLTRRQSEFGIQLDSLADLVGFGVAPAMLAWSWRLHELGTVGLLCAFWYVVAAAFRLARFNVATVDASWPLHGHAQGLTTTMAGGTLVSMVWVHNASLAGIVSVPAPALAVFVALLGLLMVSSVPFRNFKDVRVNPHARWILAIALGALLTSAAVVDHPSVLFALFGALYLGAGLVDGLIVAVHHRRLGRALGLSDIDDDDEDVWSPR